MMHFIWTRTAAAAAVLAASAFLISCREGDASVDEVFTDRPGGCVVPDDTPGDTPPEMPPEARATTITTVGQAYFCILDHYVHGPALDSAALLVPAFSALTQELQRRDLDHPDATLPALTGDRDRDWSAFQELYERVVPAVSDDPAVQEALAATTLQAMVDALHDDHASWTKTPSTDRSGLQLSVFQAQGRLDPVARAPVFVTRISAGSPAEAAGILLGDEIVTVNGVPPYVNGLLSEGVLAWITNAARGDSVELVLRRPATDESVTTTMTIEANGPPPPGADPEPQLLEGDIGYVALPGFAVEAADRVIQSIHDLRSQAELRGVVLDLRGNGGGDPDAVSRLLGAFAHETITGYWCDAKGSCIANLTDDSVELVDLPLVVLVDRRCASACDSFSTAVKDHQIGALVGTRTAGIVAGPASAYRLDDGSAIGLPFYSQRGPKHEFIATIGVAPDYYAPMTAADLSAGRDPGLAKALELLR